MALRLYVGFDGVSHTPTKTGLPFHGEAAMIDDTYITGKVGVSGTHPFVEHFRFNPIRRRKYDCQTNHSCSSTILEQMILPLH